MKDKIFVLGDSRTGTTSLHKFFLDAGLSSVHYFVDEVKEIAVDDGASSALISHFNSFVDNSGHTAFSDYPTRNYYSELQDYYPSAYFILSTRRDVDVWRRSMQRFFSERPDVQKNLDNLMGHYLSGNDKIRQLYSGNSRFLDICIDDGDEPNSEKLNNFLDLSRRVALGRLNAS